MASQDPFSGVDPSILEALQRFGRSAGPEGPVDPEIRNLVLARFGLEREDQVPLLERIQGVTSTFAALTPFNPDPRAERRARAGAALAGVARGAILEPLEALVEIPGIAADMTGTILEQMGAENGKAFLGGMLEHQERVAQLSDSAVDFLIRAKEGLYVDAERFAKESSGLSDIQIADAYSVGNLIGFTAPIGASIKGAHALLRIPKGASKAVPNLTVDVTSGLLFGGLLRPGDTVEERLLHMGEETAFFMAFKTLLLGAALPIKAWRSKRLRSMGVSRELEDFLRRMENGETPAMTPEVQDNLMRLLGEEELIINSSAAMDLLEQGLPERALARAIEDNAGGSRWMVEGIGGSFQDAQRVVGRFREELPGAKFDVLKAGDDSWTIVAGERGLNNRQRAQYKRHQRFEGQEVEKNGSSYVVVDPVPTKAGLIKVKTSDGKVVTLKNEGITNRSRYVEEGEVPPMGDVLFEDYRGFVDEIHQAIRDAPSGFSPEDIVRGLREGTLNLSENLRRDLNLPGTIVYPEEMGLRPQGVGVPTEEAGGRLGEKALEAAGRVAEGGQTNPIAVISFELGGTSPFSQQARRAIVHQSPDGPWQLTYFDESERVLGSRPFESVEEATQAAQAEGWVQREVKLHTPMTQEVVEDIGRRGSEGGAILSPQPIVTHDNLFEAWVSKRGLPEGAGDETALKAFFNDRLKQELWKTVPAEDAAVFERIRSEIFEAAQRREIPLESLAHTKGFRVVREGDGVVLQDLNTGARFRAAGDSQAYEALLRVERDGQELIPDLIPWDSRGIMNISEGFPKAESWWSLDEHVDVEDWTRQISRAMLLGFTKNNADLLVRLEEITGLPVWSEGFEKIDTGLQRMRNELDPLAKEVQNIWKGISREQKERIVGFWQQAEGTEIGLAAGVKKMRELGFSGQEIRAWERSRTLFEHLYQIGETQGIFKRGQYINNYYSRVRPFIEKNKHYDPDAIFGVGKEPPEFQFWAEMNRTGDLSMIETDPEIVMHKYLYRLLWKKNVYPHWNTLADLVGTTSRPARKIADLPAEIQQQILANNPNARPDHDVIPNSMKHLIQEYLSTVRGAPTEGFQKANKTFRTFMSRIGLDVDERLFEEFHSIGMSWMYGAAMALRPELIFRNSVQNYWMLYTRLGGRHASGAFERAMTTEGINEVLDVGAIRLAEAGIPQGDAILRRYAEDPSTVQGTDPLSRAGATVIRMLLRGGHLGRKAAQKGLVPYSSGDEANRAWAYHWQKMHTDEILQKYESGKISWDKFREDGLAWYANPKKDTFEQLYNRLGREDALRFIGKQAADESNFIYQSGTQPMAYQGPWGRAFGMFGTWSVWALEHYYRRFKLGTPSQKAAFVTRNAAVAGAFSLLALETGRDLSSWMAPGSVLFGGGPFVENAIDLRELIEAPWDQKVGAGKRLASGLGSLWIPGQLAWKDFSEAMDHRDPRQAGLSLMLGGRAREGNFAMDWVYNRDIPSSTASFTTRGPNVGPISGRPFETGQGRRGGVSAGGSAPVRPSFTNLRGNM